MRRQEGRAMATEGTRDQRKGNVAKGLAVGIGVLMGALAGPGEGWTQMPAPSGGMPGPSGSAQPRGQVTAPGLRGSGGPIDPRHQIIDRDRQRGHDRDRHFGWDHRRSHYPYRGYSGGYYPYYGYYPPYGTYPGRWVWDGRNWIFVPIY
jgi:hypothetical protein